MRLVHIDAKWSARVVDPWSNHQEDHQESQIYRYGEIIEGNSSVNNFELACIYKILDLEDIIRRDVIEETSREREKKT